MVPLGCLQALEVGFHLSVFSRGCFDQAMFALLNQETSSSLHIVTSLHLHLYLVFGVVGAPVVVIVVLDVVVTAEQGPRTPS